MTAGLHPVAADGHRAPPGGVGLAAIDEEQAAFVVGARAQPSRALPGQRVPGQDGADGQLAVGGDAEGPADPAVVDGRDGGHALQFRLEHGGPLAAHDRLQRLADPQHVPQFGLGAATAGGGQPGPGPDRIDKRRESMRGHGTEGAPRPVRVEDGHLELGGRQRAPLLIGTSLGKSAYGKSQAVVERFRDRLDIRYEATGTRVGRARAGNLALAAAKGQWLNFLDDDDVLFADHVEVLVDAAMKSGLKGAYALSWETLTEFIDRERGTYREIAHLTRHRQRFDRLALWHHNYFPIQAVLFQRSLYERHGGFAEDMDQLAEWNLWTRYALADDFVFVRDMTTTFSRSIARGSR